MIEGRSKESCLWCDCWKWSIMEIGEGTGGITESGDRAGVENRGCG